MMQLSSNIQTHHNVCDHHSGGIVFRNLSALTTAIDNLDKKFDNLDNKFDNLEKKFDEKFDNLDKKLDNLLTTWKRKQN